MMLELFIKIQVNYFNMLTPYRSGLNELLYREVFLT